MSEQDNPGFTEPGSEIGYQEMEKLLSQQIDTITKVNDRAITLSEFNIAVASIVAAAFKIADITSGNVPANVLVWLTFGISAFVVSIYICMRTYSPRRYYRGLSSKEEELYKVLSTEPKWRAQAGIAKTYAQCLRQNEGKLKTRTTEFKWALHISYIGILLILGAVLRPAFPETSFWLDFVAGIVVLLAFLLLHFLLPD